MSASNDWIFINVIAAFVYLACEGIPVAQSDFKVQPMDPFEDRLDAIARGKADPRITGKANSAPDGAYPWVVSIGVRDTPHSMGHFCGGSLIDPDWVLTAAHCVSRTVLKGNQLVYEALSPQEIQVKYGSNQLSFGGKVAMIQSILIHPEYTVTAEAIPINDVALLKLRQDLPAQYIELLPTALSEAYQSVLIAGWGRIGFGEQVPLSNTLLQAFITVVANDTCNGADRYNGRVDETMLCAGGEGVDACQGDSGGPAMAYVEGNPLLAGVISWGVECGNDQYPGVYVRVTRFDPWIHDTLASR